MASRVGYKTHASHSQTIVQKLPTHKFGQNLKLVFSEREKTITAYVIDKNRRATLIKKEHLPKEFKLIQSSLTFRKFFKDAYPKVRSLSNGDFCLSIHQRSRGGMFGGIDFTDENQEKELATETMNLVMEGQKEIADHPIKENIIMLVGATGAGKSLLGNHINSIPIVGIPSVNQEFRFIAMNPIMKVGNSFLNSCTSIPGIHNPPGVDYTYIDAPGFGDSHGPFQDIANAFFRAECTKDIKKLKLLLLVEYNDVRGSGKEKNFKVTLQDLIHFLGCCQDETGLKEAADSIALVVTKVAQPKSDTEDLIKKIEKKKETLKKFLRNPSD